MMENNKTKLLRAAAKLFAEKGYAAVSTRDLCQEAEVNVAAISYYFGGKEGLFLEVFQVYAQKLGDKIRAVLDQHQGRVDSPAQFEAVLGELIGAIVDLRLSEPELEIVLQRQSLSHIAGVKESLTTHSELIGEPLLAFFQEMQTKNLIRDDLDLRSFLAVLFESIWGYYSLHERGLMLFQDSYRLPKERDRFVAFLTQLYARGIRP